MIHFQAKEYGIGATLRATEAKPKLDRFLGEWYRRKHGTELLQDHPEWRGDGTHDALDYRMHFRPYKHAEHPQDPPRPYFGNMGVDAGERHQMFLNKFSITMTILCFHRELSALIDECLPTFFLLVNFGTRQDKGFGCFAYLPDKRMKAEDAERILSAWYGEKPVYKMAYRSNSHQFEEVDTLYRLLKAGVNESYQPRHPYCKAYLTKYFLEKGIGGEKRFIKDRSIGPALGHAPEGTVKSYAYIRGLLGSCDGQQWKSAPGAPPNLSIKYEPMSQDVRRIPSPVVFKWIDSTLFILPNDPLPEVYGQEFRFSSGGGRSGTLRIPSKDQFDIDELFRGFCAYVNSEGVRTQLSNMKDPPRFATENVMMEPCKGGRD